MEIREVEDLIFDNFPFEPTEGQRILILALAEFVLNHGRKEAFLFRGYAGTGKTTLLSALVKAMPKLGYETMLLAPTGRAAKVLASYTGKQAFTIHKKIYQPKTTVSGQIYLNRLRNYHKRTLFIIDEASMIPGRAAHADGQFFSDSDLLTDLIEFVFSGEKCTLLFIGDTAQLPPVGMDSSPAMDAKLLTADFGLLIRNFELTQVMRQSFDSGILANATLIRNKIATENFFLPVFNLKGFSDISLINGAQLEDALMSAHSGFGSDNTIVITRSNKRANIYNREIRQRILYREQELAAGDLMMVVKNNYFWLPETSAAGFIANGDIVEIMKLKRITELYGFRFAEVIIRFVDYPDQAEIEVKLMLDVIMAETPALSFADSQKLFEEISKDYEDIPERRQRTEKVKNNPFFNALQVKFAYALTCHKTQGGQWETIFIDQPFIKDEKIDKEFLRWLYTAVTRATRQVFLVNFSDNFFTKQLV